MPSPQPGALGVRSMAAVQQQGPVQLALTPSATGYRPGDTVTALLQASTSQPDSVELQEVEIDVTGVERIDTSWVSPAYRREVPPINNDRRRLQRLVIHSRLQAATQGAFSDSSLRRFVIRWGPLGSPRRRGRGGVSLPSPASGQLQLLPYPTSPTAFPTRCPTCCRFALPSWLPPTFRGTAVRYSYALQARVSYRELQPGELAEAEANALPAGDLMPEDLPQANGDDSDDETHAGSRRQRSPQPGGPRPRGPATTSVTVLIPLHIWPLRAEAQLPLGERPNASGGSMPNGLGKGSGGGGPLGTPAGMPGVPPAEAEVVVKCWEIGPGTAVQDAISHIAKLAAVPPTLRAPGSPQRRAARQQLLQDAQEQRGDGAADQEDTQQGGAEEGGKAAAGQQQQESAPGVPPVSAEPLRRPSISLSRSQTLEAERVLSPTGPGAIDTSSAAVRSYALRIGSQPLVRVSIHPPLEGMLHPGATLGATLEFSRPPTPPQPEQQGSTAGGGGGAAGPPARAPRCMHVLVLLETEEAVEAPWRPKNSAGIRRVWDEHSEVTGDAACSHFMFTVPTEAAPTFQTPLVQLRWLLRFQFVASTPKEGQKDGGSAPPIRGDIEQLTWALPLTVLSPRA